MLPDPAAILYAANLLEAHPDPGIRAVAVGLRLILANPNEAAVQLGLRQTPGSRTLATQMSKAKRNKVLLQMADQFYRAVSKDEAGRQIHSVLVRYRESAWRREKTLPVCPPNRCGTKEGFAWELLMIDDSIPAARTIADIISV